MKPTRYIVAVLLAISARIIMLHFLPILGFPEINMPHMMGVLYGAGGLLGWLLFLSSGATLALVYVLLYIFWAPFDNKWVNGLMFGFFVFFLSSVNFLFFLIGGVMDAPVKEHLSMATLGNLLSCLLFGVILSWGRTE